MLCANPQPPYAQHWKVVTLRAKYMYENHKGIEGVLEAELNLYYANGLELFSVVPPKDEDPQSCWTLILKRRGAP